MGRRVVDCNVNVSGAHYLYAKSLTNVCDMPASILNLAAPSPGLATIFGPSWDRGEMQTRSFCEIEGSLKMRSGKQPQFRKTHTRRDFSIVAFAGIAALAQAGAAAAAASSQITQEEALKALDPWLDAVFSGDPVIVEQVLAPEFQILRSDGSGHDKTSYLKLLPRQRIRGKLSDIAATGTADVMVVRYRLETDQTIEGKDVKGISPRLSVFRREAGRWMICAHANFATLV